MCVSRLVLLRIQRKFKQQTLVKPAHDLLTRSKLEPHTQARQQLLLLYALVVLGSSVLVGLPLVLRQALPQAPELCHRLMGREGLALGHTRLQLRHVLLHKKVVACRLLRTRLLRSPGCAPGQLVRLLLPGRKLVCRQRLVRLCNIARCLSQLQTLVLVLRKLRLHITRQ